MVRSISPKSSPARVVEGHARDHLPVLAADGVVGAELAAVERGRGGDHLHRRTRLIAGLGGAVEEGRVLVLVQRLERPRARDLVRVIGGDADHRLDLPGRGHHRDDRSLLPVERVERRLLGLGIERGLDVVPLLDLPPELVDDREELGLVADQLVVVGELEADAAALDEAVADRVAEQAPLRVLADEDPLGALAARIRGRDHRAVGGEDVAAVDLLLLEQRPLVGDVVLQSLGVEDRPVRGEAEQQRVEHDDDAEELDDRRVHAYSASIASASRRARRRALSETIRSSARRMKFATIELPP